MWIPYALASAFFAGLTGVLAKVGVKNVNSSLATALRTVVVLVFAWAMVFAAGSEDTLSGIGTKSLVFLVLSGLATGASWLCYYKALQMGDINKVVPVDKSSTVLTMLLAFVFLGEKLSWLKAVAMIVIAVGTYLMIDRKESTKKGEKGGGWLLYALGAAVFASLTAILGKVGIEGVESNLGTAIRTCVVLVMAWGMVFLQGKQKETKHVDRKSWLFIVLSGLATGLSWLCFFHALQQGPASVVVPIDKLSILVTAGFGFVVFREKLTPKSASGLALIVAGTLALL